MQDHDDPNPTGAAKWFRRIVPAHRHETTALLWAFAYFGCILASWYTLRPLRDEMGNVGGTRQLPWLFSATFAATIVLVPVYSWIVSRLPRRVFVPLILHGFAAVLAAFWCAFRFVPESSQVTVARVFFVWATVYSIFAVTLFWSHVVDLFTTDQGRRLFGFIAGGGTVGGILGSLTTALLARRFDPGDLVFLPVILLEAAILCSMGLTRAMRAGGAGTADRLTIDTPICGSAFAGFREVARSGFLLGIAGYMFFATWTGTIVYLNRQDLVSQSIGDGRERTWIYANMDLVTQIVVALIDIFLTARLIRRFGVGTCLVIVAAVNASLFAVGGLWPLLTVVIVGETVRRIVGFSLATPSREILFTTVDREDKYKAKGFIDNVVFRGGDAVAAWMWRGLHDFGLGVASLSWLSCGVCFLWGALGRRLGKEQARRSGSR